MYKRYLSNDDEKKIGTGEWESEPLRNKLSIFSKILRRNLY